METPQGIYKSDVRYEYYLVNSSMRFPINLNKDTYVKYTPMDMYVKEYLLRNILVAFDNSDNPEDIWNMSLVSSRWKMYCDGFTIEFIKENTDDGYLIKTHGDNVYVNRRDDEDGISTRLSDEANSVVLRYIRGCTKPVQTPATHGIKMAVMFYAGKEDVIPDVSRRVFKERLVESLVILGSSKDRNPNNYNIVVNESKIVIIDSAANVIVLHHRYQLDRWELLYGESSSILVSKTIGDDWTEFCDMLTDECDNVFL